MKAEWRRHGQASGLILFTCCIVVYKPLEGDKRWWHSTCWYPFYDLINAYGCLVRDMTVESISKTIGLCHMEVICCHTKKSKVPFTITYNLIGFPIAF